MLAVCLMLMAGVTGVAFGQASDTGSPPQSDALRCLMAQPQYAIEFLDSVRRGARKPSTDKAASQFQEMLDHCQPGTLMTIPTYAFSPHLCDFSKTIFAIDGKVYCIMPPRP